MHVAVLGAGAFGGWTALNLLRSGARVTLVEPWGAGNPLSSSGGESRVIRHVYRDRIYVDMTARALRLWREANRRWDRPLFSPKGVLFMDRGDGFLDAARAHMEAAGIEFELLDEAQLARRYPQINTVGLKRAIYEPGSGYVRAREACVAVRDAFVAEGGDFLVDQARPGRLVNGEMQPIRLRDGTRLQADAYLFACGPWLGPLFPETVGAHLKVTRQEVYFFTPPPQQARALHADMPVWAEVGERFWYGIPGPDGSFKIGDDTRGPEVDPSTQTRAPTVEGIESARAHMEYRFPGMRGAPLADSRVCQYTDTPDGHFFADRHPRAENVWLLGGGSGHGFKHGPALGERVAAQMLGREPPEPAFRLQRFAAASG